MEVKIGKSFKLTKKLGSGAFGEIFHGINLKTNMEVAVKLEPVNTKHVYYCATEGRAILFLNT